MKFNDKKYLARQIVTLHDKKNVFYATKNDKMAKKCKISAVLSEDTARAAKIGGG